ncbi:hypothetical protein TWF751_003250 [Orbilia oligospora]|nr:hypothetical protein TWF751_003250 [Orbilia oligospora]
MVYNNDYTVDSYHINIGAGDAAIHVWTYGPIHPPKGAAGKKFKRQAVRVIFVDGGTVAGTTGNKDTIDKTILEIQARYEWPRSNILKFDAFVVTHWDADHYQGIVRYLVGDVQRTLRPTPAPARLQRAYFDDRGNPLSYFFAPYLYERPKKTEDAWGYDNLKQKASSLRIAISKTLRRNKEDKDLLDIYSENAWATKMLKIRIGPLHLLGRNLFRDSDKQVSQDEYTEIESLDDLIKKAYNPPACHMKLSKADQPEKIPGFYCIAVNQKVLGQRPYKIATTKTNKSSICFMIVWSHNHRSHYLGGDADIGLERRILRWTNPGFNRDNVGRGDSKLGKSVSCMKLSHHGARTSNPIEMMIAFNPVHIIASAGGGGYGHPRWELIALMEVLNRRKSRKFDKDQLDDNPLLKEFLFLTCYPGWLVQNHRKEYALYTNQTSEISAKSFKEDFDLARKVNPINSKKTKSIYDLLDSWEAFVSDKKNKNPSPVTRRDFICNAMTTTLKSLSNTKPSQCRLPLTSVAADKKKFTQLKDSVVFIKVTSNGERREEEGVTEVYAPSNSHMVGRVYRKLVGKVKGKDSGAEPVKVLPRNPRLPRNYDSGPAVLLKTIRKKHSNVRASRNAAVLQGPFSWEWVEVEDINSFASRFTPPRESDSSPVSLLLDETPCYFIPETIAIADVPDVAVVRVPQNHYLFNFLASLEWQGFGIQRKPENSVPFLDDDDLTLWFAALTDDDNIALTVKFSPWPPLDSTVNIPGRDINLGSTASAQLSMGFLFAKKHRIIMDTESAATVLDDTSGSSLQQMLINRCTMVFGLNPSCSSFKIPLSEVAGFFGFSEENYKILSLACLGGMAMALDVDTAEARPKSRNAVWFRPTQNNETIIRLQFTVETPEILNNWFQDKIDGFKVSNIKVIGSKKVYLDDAIEDSYLSVEGDLSFVADLTIGDLTIKLSIRILRDSISLRLQNDTLAKDTVARVLSWLETKLGLTDLDLSAWLQSAGADTLDLDSVTFRKLEITIGLDEAGKLNGVESFLLSFQVLMKIGRFDEDKGQPLVFLFDFGWSPGQGPNLKGALWSSLPTLPSDAYLKAVPGWERHLIFEPLTGSSEPAETLNLKKLLSSDIVANIPKGIPTDITEVVIEIDKNHISFHGAIECDTIDADSKVPILALERLSLYASYTWESKPADLYLALGISISLYPPDVDPEAEILPELEPAALRGQLEYSSASKSWSINARVEDLTIAHIASFWAKRSRNGVMAFLERIRIEYLSLEYHYDPVGGDGKSFKFDGLIAMGKLNFNFIFKNTGQEWDFVAKLAIATEGELASAEGEDDDEKFSITVREILESLLNEAPPELPDAILNIRFDKPPTSNDIFRLECFERQNHVVFMFTLNVGPVSLSFTQFRHVDSPKTVPSKRFIKAAITKIPTIDVGIVGKLPQPFDQLYFLWVSGNSKDKSDNRPRGITNAEVKIINAMKESEDSGGKLFFKQTKDLEKYEETEVVITSGSHIFVIMKKPSGESNVLLDYAFKSKSESKLSSTGKEVSKYLADGTDTKSAKAPLKKSIGPLSIENIGLIFKDGHLGVMFDATFLMGPVGLSLLGFGVKVPFNDKFSLSNPPGLDDVSFSLDGMVVSFDKAPLTVAGGFMKTEKDGGVSYAGGLIIKFDPWQFQAAGVYATIPRQQKAVAKADESKFTMVFMFFKLNGPLFSVGFADISGLTGGFGVNSDINVPTIEQVVNFPFIKPDGTGGPNDTPLDTIKNLLSDTWFTPSEGKFWVAAGLKVNAFQMLSVDAVLVLQFNPSVKIGIYGVATCDIPSSKSSVKFAYVELGISSCLDIEAGTFKVEAQLSPKSFVLHHSCHLTGGFALFSWFKEGPNSIPGDWVMTIGGYHQAFVAPTQYPRPPRLRISWSLGKHLSVTGEAYFAITPKICMGGGRLHAALSIGALYAYFDAYIDFLINYKPFQFQAQGGVSVGVRYTMDLWLVTIRISVEIGATLRLAGPPFGGTVHVDFWVFGFDVNFGASSEAKPKLTLQEFWETALKDSKSSSGAMITSGPDAQETFQTNGTETAFLISCESGLEPEEKKETKQNDPWFVRPDSFGFSTTLKFAANDITFTKTLDVENSPSLSQSYSQEVTVDDKYKNIYARPMEVSVSLTSKLTVTVSQKSGAVRSLRHTDPGQLLAFLVKERSWKISSIVKAMPMSIWGSYDPGSDPKVSGNRASKLLDGKDVSLPLVMGLSIKPPEPEMSDDGIKKFNIVKDMKQSVYTGETVKQFPKKEAASRNWCPRLERPTSEQVVAIWKYERFDPVKVVEVWATRLGLATGTEITGLRPKSLLEKYEHMVPAMPLIAVGSGAQL